MSNLQSLLDQVDNSIEEIIRMNQELTQIPSVNSGTMPTGNETAVAKYLQNSLLDAGIKSKLLGRDSDRCNFLSDYPSKSNKTRLMFMSHTDVVPVENEEKWKFDPFSGTIHEGRVYGRGANDCKALLTTQMMAMKILKRNNIILDHGLKLVSGADEEHGGKWGFKWLSEKHPKLIKSEFAINEGGSVAIESDNKLVLSIGVGEKGRLELRFKIKGESGHASTPWMGKNASFQLAKLLKNLEDYNPEIITSLPFFNHLHNFGIEESVDSKNFHEVVTKIEKSYPAVSSLCKALSQMLITPTMVQGGVKSNSIPEEIELICDVRNLPFQKIDYVISEIEKISQDIEGLSYDLEYMSEPNESNINSALTQAIIESQSIIQTNKEISWVPLHSPGFTDSTYTRNLGTTTYGFYGSDPGDDSTLNNIHGTNESVGIASLISGTKSMIAIALKMCMEKL